MAKTLPHVKAIVLRLDLRNPVEQRIASEYDNTPSYRKSDYLRHLLASGISTDTSEADTLNGTAQTAALTKLDI